MGAKGNQRDRRHDTFQRFKEPALRSDKKRGLTSLPPHQLSDSLCRTSFPKPERRPSSCFLSHALEHTYGAQCYFSASSYCRHSGRFMPPTSALLSSFLKTMSVKESMLFATSCLLFTKVIVSIETAVYRIKMLHIINGQKNQSDHPVTLWHELRISLVRLYILTAHCMAA